MLKGLSTNTNKGKIRHDVEEVKQNENEGHYGQSVEAQRGYNTPCEKPPKRAMTVNIKLCLSVVDEVIQYYLLICGEQTKAIKRQTGKKKQTILSGMEHLEISFHHA